MKLSMCRVFLFVLLCLVVPQGLRAQAPTEADLDSLLEQRTQEQLKVYRTQFLEERHRRRQAAMQALPAAGFVLPADSLALVALYNATNGPNWTDNSNWLSGPVYTWYGITVVGNRVTEIDLGLNDLSGSIPPEIGDLTALVALRFRINDLSGSIPSEIGNLVLLEDLDLHGNISLTGPIPPEIGLLTKLVYLELSSTSLAGPIPPEIGKLLDLEWLTLGSPLGGAIPPEIGNLTKLRALQVNFCQLTGSLPPELGQLTNLYWLAFYSNNLTGPIPPELGNLSNSVLLLWNNELEGPIPPELWNNTRLRTIRLRNNALTGSLSPLVGSLPSLEILSLMDNDMSGALPSTLVNIEAPEMLLFSGNEFEDIPDLSGMTPPVLFYVENNQLTFEDLEPNIEMLNKYVPQALVGTPRVETVDAGGDLTLHVPVGGLQNRYQWFKDGVVLPGATTDTHTIAGATAGDEGDYTLEITNTAVAGLTLESHPIAVFLTRSRFVSTLGTDTGNDCAESGRPCATFSHAVDMARRGDTIILETGIYYESGLLLDKALTVEGVGVVE